MREDSNPNQPMDADALAQLRAENETLKAALHTCEAERQQLETQLAQQDKYLRSVNDNLEKAQHIARIGSWDWDVATNAVTWSKEAYRIHGYDPDTFAEPVTFEMGVNRIHPDDAARIQNDIERMMREQHSVAMNYRLQLPDGTIRHISADNELVFDDDGQLVQLFGIVQDITERKESERILAEERNLLRTIIDTLPDFIYVKDRDCRYLLTNIADASWMGLSSPNEAVGKTSYDLNPSKLAEQYLADEKRVVESGEALINHEEHVIDQDTGETIWLLTTKVPRRDHDNHIIGLVGIGRDITQRKQMEEALGQSENRFRNMYNESPVMMHSIDADGRLIDVNDFWLQTMGYERDEVLGHVILDFMSEQTSRWSREVGMPTFVEEGKIVEIPAQFVKRNGEIIDGLLTALAEYDQDRQFIHSMSVIVDVTKQAQAQRRAEEQAHRFRSLFEQTSDAIFMVDLEGNLTTCNQRVVNMLGYSQDELMTMSFRSFVPEEELPKSESVFEQLLEGQRLPPYERVFRKKNGTKFQVELNVELVRQVDGTPSHIQTLARDITVRKQAEEQLRASEERYRIVSELISDYAYAYRIEADGSIVHEWTTDESFVRLTGYEPKDIGSSFTLYHPDDTADVQAQVQEVIAGRSNVGEHRILTKSGDVRWLRIYRRPIWDAKRQRVIRYYGVGQDITKRKQAEQELSTSEQHFRQLAEGIREVFWLSDPKEQEFLYISPVFETVWGYPRQHFYERGAALWETLHPDDLERTLQSNRRALDEPEQINTLEYRIVRADDEVRWIRTRSFPVKNETGQVYRRASISDDITERKKAEEALNYLNEFHRTITSISIEFINLPTHEIDNGIQRALQLIGEFVSVDRIGINMFSKDATIYNLMYEWCAPGIDSMIANYQEIDTAPFTWTMSQFRRSEAIIFSRVEDAPAAARNVRDSLLKRGTKSWVGIPVFSDTTLMGFATYHLMQSERNWSQDTVDLLRIFGEIFTNVIVRKQTETELRALLDQNAYHNALLQTAAAVSKSAIVLLDPNKLMQYVVDLIQEKFDLYYAGLFLVDEAGREVVLQAGSGKQGQQLVANGHRLPIDEQSMIGWCVAHTQARVSLRTDEDVIWRPDPALPATRSEMALPLMYRGACIGALSAQHDRVDAFSDADMIVLQTMADQVAIAIENAHLYDTITRRRRYLETMRRVSQRVATKRSPQAFRQEAVDAITEEFGYPIASIMIANDQAREFRIGAASGQYHLIFKGGIETYRQSYDVGIFGWVVRNQKAYLTNDARSDALFSNPSGNNAIQSELAVPIRNHGRLVGVLAMSSVERDAFNPQDLEAIQDLADDLALSIENIELNDRVQNYASELEHRVAERTAQLEVINKELEAFAYSVSHDLRAPLRSIDGFSLALLEDFHEQIESEGQNYLHRIRAASQRMGQLIDDLLQLSRVTRSDMQVQDIDLSKLAHEIAAQLKETNAARQVAFNITASITAQGDHRLLRIALENLLGNAWKFTGKHDHATITFGSMTGDDAEMVYFVSDDGAGFNMDYADKLFSPFQRLHAASEFEGTGIGLATVERIVARHGGRIWAQAAVEEGATFYFTLRAHQKVEYDS